MRKTHQLKRLLLLLIFAVFATPLFAQVGIEQEVTTVTNEFQAAYNRGDDNGLANLFTQNAVRINTDGTTINGAERIKQAYKSGFITSTLQTSNTITNIVVSNPNEVTVTGTYSINGNIRSNGEEIFSDGIFENTFVKVNGVWKISRMQLKDNQ
jgi:uncharacterized protein (TIGR02246 family)